MKWNFINAIKETEHRFLNFYTVHYEVEENGVKKPYSYFLASRNELISSLRIVRKEYSRPDAVLIGAYCLNESGQLSLLLEKQFRPALGREVISFPAGLMDSDDKDEIDTASRECLEETGYAIADVEVIVPPSPTSEGLSDECNSVVMCRLLEKGACKKEEFEDITASLYSEDQVRMMLKDKSLLFSNSARLLILLLLERFGSQSK